NLGSAEHAILEPDRRLHHREAELGAAVDHLDLKRVTLGNHALETDPFQDLARVAAEPRGEVVDLQAQERAAVEVGGPGEQVAGRSPAGDRAALDVARADAEPARGPGASDDGVQMLGQMGTVRVHLHEEPVTVLEALPEAGDVGAAQAELGLPLPDAD